MTVSAPCFCNRYTEKVSHKSLVVKTGGDACSNKRNTTQNFGITAQKSSYHKTHFNW